MLQNETIENNKERFISLINSIEREGFRKEELINKLINSDFFFAPASTRYHSNIKGGLCQHSLNVYDQLIKLIELEYPSKVEKVVDENNVETEVVTRTCPFSEDTLKIVALLHDFSKMNFYKVEYKNVKKYDPQGSKKELVDGEWKNYDWVVEPHYIVREPDDRFVFGDHETTSYFMVSKFTPLTVDESAAILHHHGGIGKSLTLSDTNMQSDVFNKYPLVCLLHVADYMSTFLHEEIE